MMNENLASAISQRETQNTYRIEPVGKTGVLYAGVKRLFDIFFALTVGIVVSPLMLLIALLIRLDSHGKVIYSQRRLGKDGKVFRIYKFRTMYEDAESDNPVWAKEDDPRCTKLGRKLRRCRLDELPQVWNILLGQMSVVGPRPERPYFYEIFERDIPGFKNRLAVKPGLTGLAQVNGGYDLNAAEKIIYDMEYIQKRSLWLDLKIILRTVIVVLKREGAK